jgi:Spy/CpxP family protein refolding chaperone
VRKSIIIIIAFALAVSSGAWAQGLGKGSYRHFGGRTGAGKKQAMQHRPYLGNSWDDILENRKELNLTDEQRDKIRQLSFEFKKAQVDRRANVERARLELNQLRTDESASNEAVMVAIDNLAQARAEIEKARYSFRKDIQAVLTKEQLDKMKEFRKKRPGEWGFFGPRFNRRFGLNSRSDI